MDASEASTILARCSPKRGRGADYPSMQKGPGVRFFLSCEILKCFAFLSFEKHVFMKSKLKAK